MLLGVYVRALLRPTWTWWTAPKAVEATEERRRTVLTSCILLVVLVCVKAGSWYKRKDKDVSLEKTKVVVGIEIHGGCLKYPSESANKAETQEAEEGETKAAAAPRAFYPHALSNLPPCSLAVLLHGTCSRPSPDKAC